MADLSQTVSSQPRLTENKSYDDMLNKTLSPKPKPPLLPKPQFAVSDLRNGKFSPVKKIQNSSQTVISIKNVLHGNDEVNKIQNQEETIILNNKNIADSAVRSECVEEKIVGRISEKPPALYPKPKLPPKSNAFRSARSKFSSPSSGENSPSSPQKQVEERKSVNCTPVRPPRSPKRIFKTNPLEEFQSRLLISDTSESPFKFSEKKQKSASLPRSEFVNWTLSEISKNSKTPIKYYQPINSTSGQNNSSFEKDILAPTPRPRLKNKPKLHLELDLAADLQQVQCPVYATVDYSKKRNRQSNLNGQGKLVCDTRFDRAALTSSDSLIYYNSQVDSVGTSLEKISFGSGDGNADCIVKKSKSECNISIGDSTNFGDETNNDNPSAIESEKVELSVLSDSEASQEESYLNANAHNNNYSSFNSNYNSVTCEKCEEKSLSVMNAAETSCGTCGSNTERNGTENSPCAGTPQSFLHRFVGSSPRAKEEKMAGEEADQQQRSGHDSQNNSSFLYKHNGKYGATTALDDMGESFEVVSVEDVEPNVQLTPRIEMTDNHLSVSVVGRRNSEHALQANREFNFLDAKDSSEGPSRTNSCTEEGLSLGKRFPWFGSFGKGGKKRSEKKERCSSQFYASPVTVEGDNNMNDCSRTKSLPNIKSNDITIVTDDNSLNDWSSRNTESLNSEFSTLTHNSDADDDKDSINDIEVQDKGKKENKAFLIAKELITSEEVFIDVLKLLNVDFRNFVELRSKDKSNVLPQSSLNKILNHLPELQTLNEVLLADLKKRIQNWETNPKISDVIVKKGAFLKLYTSYIQNFESQTKYLDECVAKYPKFGKILKEFESLDRCKMLSLKHYMLKPVQRIPQYRLLLSDYLKHIDESSPDYEDTENALKIVSEVADHVNRNLKYGDQNGTLMHFQSLLSDYELIKPGRELIKDGPLEKICRKSVKDRYFILLNDCLLHTTYSKSSLKIHQELPLSGMKVCCNEDQKHRYGFTVYSTTRSFILCAKSESERNEWVQSLQSAIEQYISRQKTFMNVRIPETDTFKIGKEAPVWIQDSKVTMCQICTAEFTSLFRRHHCRACGKVICKNCGGSQAPLQYDSFKPHRVCDQCFPILLKDYEDSEDDIYEILKMNNSDSNQDIQNIYLNNKAKFIKYTSTSKPKFIPPRLKEVSANDAESEMNGLLYRKSRKAWKLYWYVLKEHVLYVYRASEDVKALETIPVLGYEVRLSEVNHENVDKSLIFILEHRHQSPIVFHAETEESAERWYKALKKASEFEELSGS